MRQVKDLQTPVGLRQSQSSKIVIPHVYTISTELFKESIEELTNNILAPFFATNCVKFGDVNSNKSIVVAGGYLRNYLDRGNRYFNKAMDDAESDIDIYLLGNDGPIELVDDNAYEVERGSSNEFQFKNEETGVLTKYVTVGFLFNNRRIQIIDVKYYIDSENVVLVPTNALEIINTFDFVCCMAGAEFVLSEENKRTNLLLKDLIYHPEFMLSVSNKILLLNDKCTTPLSLERYSKYVHEYGYKPRRKDFPLLRRIMGIPEFYGKEYDE